MPHRGRLLLQRLLLIVVLLAPGTPAVVIQRASAQVQRQRAEQPANGGPAASIGQPPDDAAHFLSTLPDPSGANPLYPANHSFDANSASLGSFGPNAGFEDPPTDVGTPPDNADFEAPTTDVGTPPQNHDFETGDLTGWTPSGNVGISQDSTHGYWARVWSGASLISPAFDVDSSAQVVAYDLGFVGSPSILKVYLLSGPNYGTSHDLGQKYCGPCGYWQTQVVDVHAYVGQSIKLKFVEQYSNFGVDNIRMQQFLPDYTLNGSATRQTESNGNTYAKLSSGTLTSGAFTVDAIAQYATLRLKGFGTNPQYQINLLSGTNFSTKTQLTAGYGNTSAWDTIRVSLASWQGQPVKLQVNEIWASIGIDDVGFQVNEIAGWDATASPSRRGDDTSGHYVSTNGNLTTPAFTVPADMQQFSLRYRGENNSAFYIEILSGTDFSQVSELDYVTDLDTTNWTTAKYAITSFAGQTVKLRIHQWFGRGQYDDVGLGEAAVPGWNLGTGSYAVSTGTDTHGSYVTAYNPGGTYYLVSTTISTGLIDRPNVVDQRYYAISYTPGSGSGGFWVYWINSSGQSYDVLVDPVQSGAGTFRTTYFSVLDSMGATGHFGIKDLTGGKVYSLADNVARQQLNEPFARKVGLQVDTSSGSFGYQQTDLSVTGAMPLTLQRFYVTQSDQYGTLGSRWSETYDTRLVLDSGGNAGVVFGSGAEEFFAYNSAANSFSPADARTHDVLAKLGDGSFTFTSKSNLTYHFDTAGVLQTITDLNGNTITLAYDGSGRLSSVTDPAGQALTYAYDANGRLSTVTDPVGAVETYSYDANGDLTTATDPEGGVTTYAYDRHRLTQVTDPNTKTLFVNTYDSANRIITQTDALGKTITIAYDTPGVGATAVTDPNGGTATYYFDQYGRTTDQVDPEEHVISYLFDGSGNLQQIIDPALNQWQFAYDSDADLTSQTDPLSNPVSISYNPQHLPTTIQDARGNVTTLTYDTHGNVLTKTDPLGKVTSYTYDAHGFLASTTNPLNQTETYTNDAQGHRLSKTDALGHTWSWTYDSAGRMSSETDPNGHTTSYGYDLNGRPLTITDALNHTMQFLYDPAGHLLMAEDELGHQTFWGYDDRGLVISKTDPAGKITTYSYDDNRNMTAKTDPLGHTTSYAYDANNRLISITDPLNHTTSYGYDDNGNVVSVTDTLNQVTTYAYDSANHLTSITLPNTGVYSFTYDADGNRLTATDPLNHVTSYAYDALSRQTSITDANSHTTTNSYDDAGQLIAVVDALNQTTSYDYDAAGRLSSVTDPLSHVTSYGYNAAGNRTSVTDPLNHTTTYGFDALNRVVSVTDPDSHTTQYAFDAVGNLTSVTDPLNHVTSYVYDARNLLTSVTDPLNRVTSYTYDDAGNRLSTTNPRNATTSYRYDAANELTVITDALTGTVSFGYDAAGQQTALTNPRGQTTTSTYDALGNVLTTTDPLNRVHTNSYNLAGQLTGTTDARNISTTFSYDAVGNLLAETSPDGTISYAYDALNRQTSLTDLTGTTAWTYNAASQLTQAASPEGTIDYGYDAAGQQTSMTLPGSRAVGNGYDPAGQLTSLTDWLNQTTSYGYDANGQQTSVDRPNGVSTTTTYDAAGQISSIDHHDVNGTLQRFSYAYDDAGNRISVLTAAGTERYTFDLLNRLTEVDYANGDVVTYSYDANGNRLTQTVNGVATNYTYDHADQLTDVNGTSYSYDANGNRTAAGSDTFSWDAHNQLTSATVNGSTTDYGYDGSGNQVSRTSNGTTTTNLWDDSSGLAQLVDDGSTSYVQANGAQEAIDSGNTTSYPLTDALGSVRGITDSSGTLTGSTDYDAFGAVRSQTGSSLSLGYTGQLTDPRTGFVDLRARQLDPTLGRFLSADTVQPNAPGSQGYNLYAYVANNPTTWTDLSGNLVGDPTTAASGTAMVGIFAILLTSAVAGACIATAGWCLPFLVLGLGLSSTTGLLVATAVIVITFALIACALDAACQALTHRIGATVAKYGSAAVAGAWSGGPEDARHAAGAFPVIPAVSAVIDGYRYLTERTNSKGQSPEAGAAGPKSQGQPAGDSIPVKDLKRIRDDWIEEMGGEAVTSELKAESGQSQSDLYYDPDTGNIYAIPKRNPPTSVASDDFAENLSHFGIKWK